MKKTNLLSILMLALLLITSCDSDDDLNTTTETTPTTPNIVLNEIEYLGDSVEIRNNGSETVDISDFFLCLGPTTYRQIGALPVVSGSTTLEPGALLVVTYDQINSAAGQISNVSGTGGLGLYINNSGFANAANLVDFVQWGASGSTRETTAVEAGIWTDGEFVPVVNNPANSIIFDGMGNSASDFSETTTPSFGMDNDVAAAPMIRSIVLNEVEFLGDRVEILNNGNVDVDISDYFLCLGPGTYRQVGALPVVSGSTMLAPGEFLVVTYDPINSMAGQINGVSGTGGLGLYIDNTGFADPSTISDFVQWGGAGSSRETTAVAAGIWTMGDFVPVTSTATNSIIYDGMGDEASDFSETTMPSFGMENGMASAPAIRSIVLNEIEYLGNRVEIFNNGDVAADISGYFLCLGPGTYRQVGALPIVSGNTMLNPGDFLVVTYDQINTTAGQINNIAGTGGLGLYINNSGFANPDNLMDYVQWGAAGSVREVTAVAAGIWTMGDFVSVTNTAANSIIYDGMGDEASDFSETTMPSFGMDNGNSNSSATVNFTFDDATVSGVTVTTQPIMVGSDQVVLSATAINNPGNDPAALFDLGGGDLAFFLNSTNTALDITWQVTLTVNGNPTNFTLNGFDYASFGGGTFDLTNDSGSLITDNHIITGNGGATGNFPITNVTNAMDIPSFNIIGLTARSLTLVDFHNISVTLN